LKIILNILENQKISDKKNKLLYKLIFAESDEFNIDIADYVSDIYDYDDFVSDIKSILKKSKVVVISSDVKLDSKTAIWYLKVRK